MKTLLLAIALLTSTLVLADNYETAMKEKIASLFKTQNIDDFNQLAAGFKRIAAVENSQWLPRYYAAYAYARSTHFMADSDSIDQQLDKAQEELNLLLDSHNKESEVHTLQALVYSLRITSPMRGYKYSNLSNESLAKAEKLNAANPRIYYCRANNVYHTPKMFGGGKQKAQVLYEKAAELFVSINNENPLWPNWGSYHNQQMLNKCLAAE